MWWDRYYVLNEVIFTIKLSDAHPCPIGNFYCWCWIMSLRHLEVFIWMFTVLKNQHLKSHFGPLEIPKIPASWNFEKFIIFKQALKLGFNSNLQTPSTYSIWFITEKHSSTWEATELSRFEDSAQSVSPNLDPVKMSFLFFLIGNVTWTDSTEHIYKIYKNIYTILRLLLDFEFWLSLGQLNQFFIEFWWSQLILGRKETLSVRWIKWLLWKALATAGCHWRPCVKSRALNPALWRGTVRLCSFEGFFFCPKARR